MAGWCEHEYGCRGVLTISGVALASPAWDIPNLTPLWYTAAYRGESIVLATAAGRRSNPQRYDEVEIGLLLVINGTADHTGTPFANPWAGLAANLMYLRENVLAPVDAGRGTRPASLLMPDGVTVLSADVRTGPLEDVGGEPEDPTFAEFTLPLTIPNGIFE